MIKIFHQHANDIQTAVQSVECGKFKPNRDAMMRCIAHLQLDRGRDFLIQSQEMHEMRDNALGFHFLMAVIFNMLSRKLYSETKRLTANKMRRTNVKKIQYASFKLL